MLDQKNVLFSKTIIGIILTVAAPFLDKLFGVSINETLQADVSEALFNIVEAGGAALAVYGRIRATKSIKLI